MDDASLTVSLRLCESRDDPHKITETFLFINSIPVFVLFCVEEMEGHVEITGLAREARERKNNFACACAIIASIISILMGYGNLFILPFDGFRVVQRYAHSCVHALMSECLCRYRGHERRHALHGGRPQDQGR